MSLILIYSIYINEKVCGILDKILLPWTALSNIIHRKQRNTTLHPFFHTILLPLAYTCTFLVQLFSISHSQTHILCTPPFTSHLSLHLCSEEGMDAFDYVSAKDKIKQLKGVCRSVKDIPESGYIPMVFMGAEVYPDEAQVDTDTDTDTDTGRASYAPSCTMYVFLPAFHRDCVCVSETRRVIRSLTTSTWTQGQGILQIIRKQRSNATVSTSPMASTAWVGYLTRAPRVVCRVSFPSGSSSGDIIAERVACWCVASAVPAE